MKLNTTINGKKYSLDIEPNALLADVLRQTGFKSVKIGCREGSCGACAVLIDGKPRNSCITMAALAQNCEITTVEGLGTADNPHLIQEEFVASGSVQCGYCNPGSIIATKALLDSNSNPTVEDVKDALDGNLCRCTGYVKRVDAVLKTAKKMQKNTKKSKGE